MLALPLFPPGIDTSDPTLFSRLFPDCLNPDLMSELSFRSCEVLKLRYLHGLPGPTACRDALRASNSILVFAASIQLGGLALRSDIPNMAQTLQMEVTPNNAFWTLLKPP
ncbi:hypothetical protein BDU57DRAFT_517263 [Ampelomyces quisqualis]|uniref:Uncharacterized protein n=1 Tax=Ampelomyces quisqualis TaxID=50730 RepID=A0A6A5QPU0_AMPQU|nr:hypothetical protein BDU57DRAFT_517263 [Ampelomyces quisqualis]